MLPDGQGAHAGGHVHVGTVSTHAPSDAIIVPDAHLLFTGDFKRAGVDLILSGDHRELVLHDYFKGEKRAALASPDGAHLTGDIVDALVGYTQFAQADGSASVAPPVIGHVTKLTGSATAIRNGVSIILNQGDNVLKGDVVQSGSNSTLGITFIDGTVFGLASNAKMVLNEMIYDPNRSDNKSLISLVQGTISFVAGATAKHGDMKVDTPVATMGIRGTAVLVEIDFTVPANGGAPPAKFQVLVEPDGTTGSYILFDKTTLTPIATVNQAGTATIVNGQGGVNFLSSAQLSADAQKIITDVFALKFSDLNNPNTKTAGNQNDSIVPETLFVKTANGEDVAVKLVTVDVSDKSGGSTGTTTTTTHDHVAGKPDAAATSGALAERVNLTAGAVTDSVSGTVKYLDVNPGDVPTVKTAFASFTFQNAQHADVSATLTAEQLAAIQAVEVPLVVVQDPAGVNFGTATWTYNIVDGAFDFLAVGETLTLTYIARVDNNFAPNNETSFRTITITVTGTNDAPTVVASGGAITELIGTGNTATDIATGTVTFADVDLTDRPVVSAALSVSDPFRYFDADGHDVTATLTPEQLAAIIAVEVPLTVVQTAGNSHDGSATWTYSIADSAFDFIAEGETLTLNYVASVDDGHGGVVSTPITVSINGADITVTGTDDVPTIETTSNAFAELSNQVQPNPTGSTDLDTVSGTISFTDVDLTDRPVASAEFTSFTYTDALGCALTLTPLQEADVAAVAVPLSVTQTPGNTNNGSATWTYSVADGAFDFLADGEILTLTYTATVDDGRGGVITKPFTVTVTGTNDTPTSITASSDGFTEQAGTGNAGADHAGGTISFTDVDLSDRPVITAPFSTYSYLAADGTTSLQLTPQQASDLEVALTLTPGANTNDGSATWSYDVTDSKFDFLAEGETLTLTYTATVDDGHGGIVTTPIAVTVTGTNDTPTSITASSDSFTELAGTGNGDIDHAGGSITFTDVDLSDRPVISAPFSTYSYLAADGITSLQLTPQQASDLEVALTLTPGANTNDGSATWSYDVTDSKFDFLAEGETLTLTYTATVDDGHGGIVTTPIAVTVTGTNDTPVINAATTVASGIVSEGDPSHGADMTATGTITYTDADTTDTHAFSLSGAAASYGTAGVDPVTGLWTYTVIDSGAVDALAAGEHLADSVTVKVADNNGGSSTQLVTIDIVGTNDAPDIHLVTTDSAAATLTETNAGLTTSRTLTVTDPDLSDTVSSSVTAVVASGSTTGLGLTNGQLLAMLGVTPASGLAADSTDAHNLNWTFNSGTQAFNYLASGQSLTLTYTVQSTDSSASPLSDTQAVTVTINGSNDPAVISGKSTGSVEVADDGPGSGKLTDTGTLTDTDVDNTPNTFIAAAAGSATDHAYGTYQMTAAGVWTYTLNNSNPMVQGLHEGHYLTDTFTVHTVDGTATVVTITINDDDLPNEAPVFTGEAAGVAYHANGVAVAVAANVTASDVDSANYDGGTLTATVTAGGHEGDTLSIIGNQYITIESGATVKFDADGDGSGVPITIGTVTNYDYNSLTITLNGNADDAAVAALTKAIEFSNSKPDPVAGERTVTFTLHDGGGTENGGQDSAYFTATVDVAPVNNLQLVDANFLGGAGDQAATDVTYTNGHLYLTYNGPITQSASDQSTIVTFTTDANGATQGFSDLWTKGFFNGVVADVNTIYAVGGSHPSAGLTHDTSGGQEDKSILATFDVDGTAGSNPPPAAGYTHDNFFSYNGVEMFEDVLATTQSGNTVLYAVGFGQPLSYGAYVIAEYGSDGMLLHTATDSAPYGSFSDARDAVEFNGAIWAVGDSLTSGVDSTNAATVWTASYDLSSVVVHKDSLETAGAGFAGAAVLGNALFAVGHVTSNGGDYLIAKYNTDGSVAWSHSFGGSEADTLNAAVTLNGHLYVVGSTTDGGNTDGVLMEINPADGSVISATTYGGSLYDSFNSITTDGHYLYVAGESKSFANGDNTVGQNDAILLTYEPSTGPVIQTDQFTVTENHDAHGTVTVAGLYVTDTDATASTDHFTLMAATGAAPGTSVTPSSATPNATLSDVNSTLAGGVTYDPDPGQPDTDSVTFTVTDSFGATDTVHFIFNQNGNGPDVSLTGTSGKDVIFATGNNDTLTGGAGADQFLFRPEDSLNSDTITDFTPGQDHIDLRAFSAVVDSSNINSWFANPANVSQSQANPADVIITLDANDTITLQNVALNSLHVGDFIVSPHHVA